MAHDKDFKTGTKKTKTIIDREHYLGVVSWDANKSTTQYCILRDSTPIQGQAVALQETQNWKKDCVAREVRWSLLR